jgi:hypothetical protein
VIDALLIVLACAACFVAGWKACVKGTPLTIEAAFGRGYRKGFTYGHEAGVSDARHRERVEAEEDQAEGLTGAVVEPRMSIVRQSRTVQ